MDVIIKPPSAQLIVLRSEYSNDSTIGDFLIRKEPFCLTLEDTVRSGADGILQASEKIDGETAIPAGLYPIELAVSSRFGFCPWVLNVELFEDVRIHWGNRKADTRGCTLVGRKAPVPDMVIQSRETFGLLMMELVPMRRAEKLFIEYIGGPAVEDMKRMRPAA